MYVDEEQLRQPGGVDLEEVEERLLVLPHQHKLDLRAQRDFIKGYKDYKDYKDLEES